MLEIILILLGAKQLNYKSFKSEKYNKKLNKNEGSRRKGKFGN